MRFRFLVSILLLSVLSVSVAEEKARTWTDLKGRTLQGRFSRQDDTTVWLVRDNGNKVQIPIKTLDEADRKYLKDLASMPGRGERFNTQTIDPAAWKLQPDGLDLEGLFFPSVMKTDHFMVVAEGKVRSAILKAYAEAAERLWIDMTDDLPLLVETFKAHRILIVLSNNEEDSRAFAAWHRKHAEKGAVRTNTQSLETYNIVSFALGSDLATEHGLQSTGRLFRLDSKKAQNIRIVWAERIHFLASEVFATALRPARRNDGYSLSMLSLSYAYHREFLICGKIETEVTFGGGEDIEGFSNGRNWATPTRRILARGHGPSIDAYLKKSGSKASSRDLGYGHGLMCFIHHDPHRLTGFSKMLETAVSDKECPDPETFAKALGYDSVAAFNEGWSKFMQSDDFE